MGSRMCRRAGSTERQVTPDTEKVDFVIRHAIAAMAADAARVVACVGHGSNIDIKIDDNEREIRENEKGKGPTNPPPGLISSRRSQSHTPTGETVSRAPLVASSQLWTRAIETSSVSDPRTSIWRRLVVLGKSLGIFGYPRGNNV